MMPLHRPVIERVVTQHAEDAADLRATRATLVRSPHVELHRLARHDERLYAHLDGLQVAGDEGHRIAATAIERQDRAQVDRLLALVGVVPDAERALASACGWVAPTSLRGLIAELLASSDATQRRLGIAACALHRVDPGAVRAPCRPSRRSRAPSAARRCNFCCFTPT